MTEPALAEIMKRAANWPAEDQMKLAAAAGIIEAQRMSEHELSDIDWAVIDARVSRGDIAGDEETAAVFAKYRVA
jgi:hypothetical protein